MAPSWKKRFGFSHGLNGDLLHNRRNPAKKWLVELCHIRASLADEIAIEGVRLILSTDSPAVFFYQGFEGSSRVFSNFGYNRVPSRIQLSQARVREFGDGFVV